MATALPQDFQGYNSLSTHVREYWFDAQRAQDIIHASIPVFQVLSQIPGVIQKFKIPHDIVVKIIQAKNENTTSFEGYDTVSTDPTPLAQAARFERANYSTPVAMSWDEEMDYTSDEAFADAIMEAIELAELGHAERLANDQYLGNETNPTNMLGFEQLMFPARHKTSANTDGDGDTRVLQDFQTRQADNVYGGITRVPWTDTTEGTGWEANSFDGGQAFAGAANDEDKFGILDTDKPTAALQRLNELYQRCTHGMNRPNLLVASSAPYADYDVMAMQKVELRRDPSAFADFTFGSEHVAFKSAVMLLDELAYTRNSFGGTSAPGEENVYILNTDFLKWCIDSRADFNLTDTREPFSQHSAVQFILSRCQFKATNPRMFGRYFNYPAT